MRTRKLSQGLGRYLALGLISVALGAGGCKKNANSNPRNGTQRLKWVKNPTSGKTEGKNIEIPGLGVSFETPDVLYVYKECAEASHSPRGEEGWIPVIDCTSTNAGESDEYAEDDGDGPVVLTIFAAEKDLIINERGVAILKADLQQRGFRVESIMYIEDYQGKEGRRGIESKVHVMDEEGKYPEREIQRLRFPVGDVVFIAQVDYPYGDDRSGIANDWQRILWNFQLDEDGSLYEEAIEE